MKIEKIVEVGEEQNIIAEKMATSHLSLAKFYKRRSWLEAFVVEGISQELKKEFLRKLQKIIAFLEIEEELQRKESGLDGSISKSLANF